MEQMKPEQGVTARCWAKSSLSYATVTAWKLRD